MTSKNKETVFELTVIIGIIVIVLLVTSWFGFFSKRVSLKQDMPTETDNVVVVEKNVPPLLPRMQ